MKIIKRDGSEQVFSKSNIFNAINNASQKVRIENRFTTEEIKNIAKQIEDELKNETHAINAGDIQNLVEDYIIKAGKSDVAREYIIYRYQKQLEDRKNTTDDSIRALLNCTNEELNQENGNKNPHIISTMRDYMAGEVSKDLCQRYLIPQDIWQAHKDGIIHFHDMDYFAMPMYNCCVFNLEDMLQNGTIISGVKIEKPHLFSTAATITSQICAQISSSQYGGQSFTLSHLAPFVEETRKTLRKRYEMLKESLGDEKFNEFIELATIKDVETGIQTIQYQLITIAGSNGQSPFASIFMYINEVDDDLKNDLALVIQKVLEQRILGVKNKNGAYVSTAFPKLLYVLQEDNIHEGDKWFYLTELAAKCTSKRMVPDYISEKRMKELKEGACFPCMGCRSFLQPYYEDKNGNPTTKKKGKYRIFGRFNQGVVSINLPDVALCAKKDIEKFWYILDQRLELCHRALRLRHEHLRGVKSDVAPILWQAGAVARLEPGETIDKLLYNDYSSISLGYVGIYETVKALTGKNFYDDDDAMILAKQIMDKMNEKCAQWKQIEHIGYSLYGTPEENLTYKFATALQKRHGIIPGITDKNYVTNSYHIPVFQEIDAFSKISKEAELQPKSLGGAISYVETCNLQNNIPAIISILQHIYENIMYCELNTKSDYCLSCDSTEEIKIHKDENGKLYWKCENCGETDINKLLVVRRICGYLSQSNAVNQGRMAEFDERVLHI
ncbi:MAG: anaerobic ribonucleoside-triphosphate reductase [Bacilli bacterium]|nr:anaerobic ribonucleoside-triphosphate reductase [Bacilli bacterium]